MLQEIFNYINSTCSELFSKVWEGATVAMPVLRDQFVMKSFINAGFSGLGALFFFSLALFIAKKMFNYMKEENWGEEVLFFGIGTFISAIPVFFLIDSTKDSLIEGLTPELTFAERVIK